MNINKIKLKVGKTIIVFLAFFFSYCNNSKNYIKKKTQEIHQVKLLLTFPSINTLNEFIVVRDSLYIINYNNLVLYKFPYTHEYTNNIFDSEGKIIEHKTEKIKTDFHYFVYRKDESMGYFFDSTYDRKSSSLSVDSFLKTRIFIVERLLFNVNDSLIKRVQLPGNVFQETYIRKTKNDQWDCDTNQLFFSTRLVGVDFSLSRRLDSMKEAKLVKVRQISRGDLGATNFFFTQRREVLIELMDVPLENNREIINFWDKRND